MDLQWIPDHRLEAVTTDGHTTVHVERAQLAERWNIGLAPLVRWLGCRGLLESLSAGQGTSR